MDRICRQYLTHEPQVHTSRAIARLRDCALEPPSLPQGEIRAKTANHSLFRGIWFTPDLLTPVLVDDSDDCREVIDRPGCPFIRGYLCETRKIGQLTDLERHDWCVSGLALQLSARTRDN